MAAMELLKEQGNEHMEFMQRQHERDMEEYRRQNAESIKEHTEHIANLMKELQEIKEEPFDPTDPDRLVRKQNENFQKFCDAASEYLKEVPKLKTTSIAVLGPSGVGKSTIINAFAGKRGAATDVVACTQTISMVHASPEYDMYDVPGSRDERADFYNIDNLHQLKSLHLIMVVYTDRFEHVLSVSKLLTSIGLPFIFVRNKCNFKRDGPGLQLGFQKEQALAGQIPLIYLGHAEKQDDVPENTDKLKQVVKEQLASASSAHREQLDQQRRIQEEEYRRQDRQRQEEMERQDERHMAAMELLKEQGNEHMEFMQRQHERDMEEYRRQNAESIKEHTEHIANLMKELQEIN